ncbi:MAG: hypothetical protein DRJ31_06285 [Candidatus Methanomethylicota archaeon]|uniref:Cupin type-2 domain-containing protein n=1 Tax=Thermoproteota archaeon TaxID=2056631 RepID=A0A497ENB3_9CREN|nr:MAG: hypothetical protein DRJ31_06285 [Candidatus Verstraetearchaeota archaeon]RLE52950.1 MAG: hypothetical protein DRJ33_02390 [Candidatus Verstraetearchaeota archaeon]
MSTVIVDEGKVSWGPHPLAKGVEIKNLLTKKDHGADVTCVLVKLPKGSVVPEHIHKEQDDILFFLEGRCKMFIEGIGEFEAKKGMLIRIPKNTRHSVPEVYEDTLLYDVFSPALV